MSERETRNFMSVDSFSQLPFIRSAPPLRDKDSPGASTAAASAIRLFGIEFPQEADAAEPESPSKDATSGGGDGGVADSGAGAGRGDSGRKFECHYCCRNFPTSQALGGHQNAHKRERQQAKRAYLQSSMAAHHHHQPHGYGLVNYHHLGSFAPHTRFCQYPFEHPPPSHYSSWTNAVTGGGNGVIRPARFFGGAVSVSPPLNGSPLQGSWGFPAVQQAGGNLPLTPRHRLATVLPLLGGDDPRAAGSVVEIDGNGRPSPSCPSPQGRRVLCDSAAGMQDHLSLDLHL